MGLIKKIIAGGKYRKTRFHTEDDQLVPISELAHLPRASFQFAATKLGFPRAVEPWWPKNAIKAAEKILAGSKSVTIEFGSGSSTIWLAERSEHVYAIEDSFEWMEKTSNRCKEKSLQNVTLLHGKGSEYYNLTWAKDKNLKFDFAVIDGKARWKCLEAVIPLMNEKGVIYLDNSDADKDADQYNDNGRKRRAQHILWEAHQARRDSKIKKYVSLISGEIHVGEGTFLIL